MNLGRIYRSIILVALTLVTVTSCIDEIPFSGDVLDLGINISAQFTNVDEVQRVVLRKVLDVNVESTVVGDPILDADVSIVDNAGNVISFQYSENGEYVAQAKGTVGMSYQLKVRTPNGNEYESEFKEMPNSVPIQEIKAEYREVEVLNTSGISSIVPQMAYIITTRLNDDNGPVYAIYRALGEYEFVERMTRFGNTLEDSKTCYIMESNDLGNVVTLNGDDLPNNEAVNRQIAQIAYDWRFEWNYCLHAEQYVIDKETYDYWKSVEQLVKESSLFDPPPGRIFSNVHPVDSNDPTRIRGYFTVAGKSDIRTFTNAEIEQKRVENFCVAAITTGVRNNNLLPPVCVDCLVANNSTVEVPAYWP